MRIYTYSQYVLYTWSQKIHTSSNQGFITKVTVGQSQGIPRQWGVKIPSLTMVLVSFSQVETCLLDIFSRSRDNKKRQLNFTVSNVLQVTTNHQEQSAPTPAPQPARRRRAGKRVISVWCGKFFKLGVHPNFHWSSMVWLFFQASVPWWCNRNLRRILSIATKHVRYVKSKSWTLQTCETLLHYWLNYWMDECMHVCMHASGLPCIDKYIQ